LPRRWLRTALLGAQESREAVQVSVQSFRHTKERRLAVLDRPCCPCRKGTPRSCHRLIQLRNRKTAEKIGTYRGKPLTPKKLNELPPATGYMAVYRHIGGCEVPLTMVEYRSPKRR